MRKSLGIHIDPNSKLFDIETMFFASNSEIIAHFISTDSYNWAIHSIDPTQSGPFNFAVEMMQLLS